MPDLQWVCVSTYTHTENQRLGGTTTRKGGLTPVQHIYVTNTFICRSLPNELYKLGFELHASTYLALFADAYAGLQLYCTCVPFVSLSLSLSAGEACDEGPGEISNFECTD